MKGTEPEITPPKNLFGGVANLLTGKSCSEKEEHETFKIMGLAQAVYRILKDMGVDNVARVALGDITIYEDLEDRPNDFLMAMAVLKEKVDDGFSLGRPGNSVSSSDTTTARFTM